MVPVQAAKVLSQYSDNEARNVIYKMRNKKAAEILSLLNPDYVNRITKPKL
jgi:flagellar motility protein MotE (MotC chaperone)